MGGVGARLSAVVVLSAFACLVAPPAQAAFPGANGKLVVGKHDGNDAEIYTLNPDGSGLTQLTNNSANDAGAQWSPDGTRIAFDSNRDGASAIFVMNPDGTNPVKITNDPASDFSPAWSPDGTRFAFYRACSGPCQSGIYVMNQDGTNPTLIAAPSPGLIIGGPKWSPAGDRIAFFGSVPDLCCDDVYVMNPDGSDVTQVTNSSGYGCCVNWSPDASKLTFMLDNATALINADGTGFTSDVPESDSPVWSPDGTKIAYTNIPSPGSYALYSMNPDFTGKMLVANDSLFATDWQPIPINSYPRPKGATPFLTYLVPAYAECTSPNRTHGPSLAFGSCAPPSQTSDELTVGSADSNGKPTKSVSSVRFDTVVGNPATPADEADVAITAQVIDVYTQAGLADYAGSVKAKTTLRITDKLNTPHPGGPGAGTVSDIPYEFTIPCAVTSDITIGGSCLLSTSADALAPGAVKEGKRAIWQLGQVEVYDTSDAPFMRQGIFVP